VSQTASTVDVRLAWAPTLALGRFDGAWWPRSDHVESELRQLLPSVAEHLGGRVTRVSLDSDAWSADQPRRIEVADRIVRLGWFRTVDPHTITLGRGNYDRVILLVVPFDHDAATGTGLMQRLAGDDPWPDTPQAALAATT
jgi:hypothetical protein